jgi:mannose-1-phosphate guanylyltransferase
MYWASARDSDATMVVFPADHFILEEAAFLAHLGEVIAFVEHRPEWLVLLGLRATAPDPELGWIEPGHAIGSTTAGPIARVERFREKPAPPVAAACLARGWLWNTSVVVAKAATLISVADVLLPDVHRCLSAVAPFFESRREAWALREAYARLPRHSFSGTVLQAGVPLLAVSTLPALTWSDLGTTERLFRLIRTLRLAPPWMRGRGGVLTGRTRRAE